MVKQGGMFRAKRPGVTTELLCYDLINIPVHVTPNLPTKIIPTEIP